MHRRAIVQCAEPRWGSGREGVFRGGMPLRGLWVCRSSSGHELKLLKGIKTIITHLGLSISTQSSARNQILAESQHLPHIRRDLDLSPSSLADHPTLAPSNLCLFTGELMRPTLRVSSFPAEAGDRSPLLQTHPGESIPPRFLLFSLCHLTPLVLISRLFYHTSSICVGGYTNLSPQTKRRQPYCSQRL